MDEQNQNNQQTPTSNDAASGVPGDLGQSMPTTPVEPTAGSQPDGLPSVTTPDPSVSPGSDPVTPSDPVPGVGSPTPEPEEPAAPSPAPGLPGSEPSSPPVAPTPGSDDPQESSDSSVGGPTVG